MNEGHIKVQKIYKLMKIYCSQCEINHGVWWTCVFVREHESECERAGVSVNRLKWGASGMRKNVINYFMLDINLKFIIVCIFLLPVKAALHHSGLDNIFWTWFLKTEIHNIFARFPSWTKLFTTFCRAAELIVEWSASEWFWTAWM